VALRHRCGHETVTPDRRGRPASRIVSRTLKRILLLGGGHTHLLAATVLAHRTAGHAQVSLVSPSATLLYSGMMPGWISGAYPLDACSIDVRNACRAGGIEWIDDRVVDVDFPAREVVGQAARYRFDLLSVNVGSVSDAGEGAGAQDAPRVLGAKPFAAFVPAWERWWHACERAPGARRLTVVGGGAAAIEIAFAMARLALAPGPLTGSRVTLAHAGASLLGGRAGAAAWLATRGLRARGVELRAQHRYTGARDGLAHFDGMPAIASDLVVVATGPRPAPWLLEAARRDGVALAPDGGIAVRADLRSTSHAALFAAGDCASFVDRRIAKSGVHAIRQAGALAANLAAVATGARTPVLAAFRARRWTLALLDRCDGSAIASWGPLAYAGGSMGRWKERIDRRFVARFRQGPGA